MRVQVRVRVRGQPVSIWVRGSCIGACVLARVPFEIFGFLFMLKMQFIIYIIFMKPFRLFIIYYLLHAIA